MSSEQTWRFWDYFYISVGGFYLKIIRWGLDFAKKKGESVDTFWKRSKSVVHRACLNWNCFYTLNCSLGPPTSSSPHHSPFSAIPSIPPSLYLDNEYIHDTMCYSGIFLQCLEFSILSPFFISFSFDFLSISSQATHVDSSL